MLKKLIYFLILFIVQELLLRLIIPIPELSNFNRILFQNHRNGESLPYITNEIITWQSQLDTAYIFDHNLNEYGFRDKSWTVKKDKKRIFVVGDSFVEGDMVEDYETIPAVFQKLIGEDAEVFNCGMNGTGISSYLKFLKIAVPLFKPDEVFLVFYANDIGSFILPNNSKYEANYNNLFIPRIVYVIQCLIEGKKINSPYFKPRNPFLYPVPDYLNPFTTNALELEKHVAPKLREVMARGESNYHMINSLEAKEKSFANAFDVSRALQYAKEVCENNNSRLNVVFIPDRNQISDKYIQFEKLSCLSNCKNIHSLNSKKYQESANEFVKSCKGLGLNCYDLRDKLKSIELRKNLYWDYDEHMRKDGYATAAHFLHTIHLNKTEF